MAITNCFRSVETGHNGPFPQRNSDTAENMVLLLPPAYAVEVMFSSCLCVCVSVWAITFEPVEIETLILVW